MANSLAYIDKSKAPEPKFRRTPHPPLFRSGKPNKYGKTFKSQKEEDKYWKDVQFPRWLEGHYVSDHKIEENRLTGLHYFFLQEGMIKTQTGFQRPDWRDWDEYEFKAFEKAENEGNDFMEVKRREYGFTTKWGGAKPTYNCLVHQTSNNLLTSANKRRTQDMFDEKTKVFMRYLHPYIRLGIETVKNEEIHFTDQNVRNENEVKNLSKKRRAVEEKFYADEDEFDEEDIDNIIDSRIVCAQTQVDPYSFEGYRAIYGLIDEIGIHPRAADVRRSVDKCLRMGAKRLGPIVLGGTIENMDQKGAQTMYELWQGGDNLGIDKFFVPAYAVLEGFMVNGWSYEKEAKDHILKRREELRKGTTDVERKEYLAYLKQYPLSIDEVFDAIDDDFWKENVSRVISEQQVYVKDANPPIKQGDFYNDKEVVKFYPDDLNGKAKIIEHPTPNLDNLYVAGIDPVGTAGGNSGSNLAAVVLKREAEGQSYNNSPVAIYENRDDVKTMAQDLIHLLRYFNNAKALIEQQYGDAILSYFENYNWVKDGFQYNAWKDLLAPRVRTLGLRYEKPAQGKGQYVSNKTAERFNEKAGLWLENYGRNIEFIDLLQAIAKMSSDKNKPVPDLYSAFRLAAAQFFEMQNIEIKEQNKEQTRTIYFNTTVVENGVAKRKKQAMTVKAP